MIESLLNFVIWAVVVGFIAWVLLIVLDRVPIEATFKQVARGAVIVIALLILVVRVIPLLTSIA